MKIILKFLLIFSLFIISSTTAIAAEANTQHFPLGNWSGEWRSISTRSIEVAKGKLPDAITLADFRFNITRAKDGFCIASEREWRVKSKAPKPVGLKFGGKHTNYIVYHELPCMYHDNELFLVGGNEAFFQCKLIANNLDCIYIRPSGIHAAVSKGVLHRVP